MAAALPEQAPIIDVCSLVYDDEGWRAYLDRLARHAPRYLAVFARSFTTYFGADLGSYRAALRESGPTGAVDILLPAGRQPFDLDAYISERTEQGVRAEVIMGSPARLPGGEGVNDRVARIAAHAPHRFHAWGGITLRDGAAAAVRELLRCLDLEMTGFNIIPFLDAVDVTDEEFAPLFQLADEARLSLWLHTGHHFASAVPADISTWRHVDHLAARYPHITVVAGHAGWPALLDTLMIAARHDNVLLEISSHRPSLMTQPGTGWEPLLRYGRGACRSKIMFGTSTWVNPIPIATLAAEVRDLHPGDEGAVAHDWLYGNASGLLGRTGHG
ncbi:amidohydrolase family protein [Catenulispora rubra]|uniref:amidohydrolase family protein n=1 Tax=Catenulispora rubra TaxID=280293 RepID=UPI0018927909|nr:amidohydrolase family protein [Catenulispora rubra]